MCAVALRRSVPSLSVASVPNARKAAFSAFIEPCDPTLREQAPKGDDWLYEIKADGYRAQVHLTGGKVRVYSRTGLNWTAQFAAIAHAAEELADHDFIMDGEAVVYGEAGLPDFQALRRELGSNRIGRLIYQAFDLLYLDGFDLRPVRYVERKRLLEELLADVSSNIVYVEYLGGHDGERLFEHACRLGAEGLVAKRPHAPYRSGRQESWIKLKCTKSDTFPIVAF